MISIYPLFELAMPNPLFKLCDAVVFSKKRDHKFIFLKENKPKDITPDKLRTKGKVYIKDHVRLYNVIVDMYEHKSIKSGDGDLADIWVVGNLNQAQKQLDIMIKSGAKQFLPKILKGNKI